MSDSNVLYIMYKTFRLSQNEAVEYTKRFDEHKIVIYRNYEENNRNNVFLSEGIKNANEMNIEIFDQFDDLVLLLKKFSKVVTDYPYLREDKRFVKELKKINSNLILVENQTIVPVTLVSQKEEYGARTIRKKIWDLVPDYHIVYQDENMFVYEKEARNVLEDFIHKKLPNYHLKNDPSKDFTSRLSVYLKYGFLSVSYIYDQVRFFDNADSFLEELIIRRELAYNFVYYNENYDKLDRILSSWSYQTMEAHVLDKREYIYTIEDYIQFKTHDQYFNKAMELMINTGYMHGYMRMYWCKKILEWSPNYHEAYRIAIYLNNYYFMDGNTPNGYTGVAWCFGKHDRAFKEREIFGKIRYMNEKGLLRKFDMSKYLIKGGFNVS